MVVVDAWCIELFSRSLVIRHMYWRAVDASAYGVQEQRGGRLKETDGALGGGVGSGRRHPFDFGVRVYGVR